MASGELLTKVDKLSPKLVETGLVDAPANGLKVFGAQSVGFATRSRRLCGRASTRSPRMKPTGIAKSLNIGDPLPVSTRWKRCAGPAAGWTTSTDEDVRAGIELLARTTSIFAETAGGVLSRC